MPVIRLILLLWLSFPITVAGQQLHFKTRTFEYNNEPLKVRKLCQDASGFIWLGTGQGLFQYDGVQTKPVLLAASRKPLPPVSALFEDKQKQLWIGCENGRIYRLKDQKLTAFEPEEGNPKVSILAIQQDLKGNIWFATYGEGLYCWKNNRLYNLNTADGLPDDYVYTLTQDKAGNIWAGTDRGIAICNFNSAKKQVQKLGSKEGLPDNIVTALAICSGKKTIWAGTYSGGFCTIDAATKKITLPEISKNWEHGVISQIQPATSTASFIATLNGALLEYDTAKPNQLTALETQKSAAFKITDLLSDSEGLVWLAGNSGEVRLANPVLRFLDLADNGRKTGALAILPDKKGNVWFSTDEGLFCSRKQAAGFATSPVFISQPFRKNKVISLYEDTNGFIWSGTFGGGVFRLDPATQNALQFTEKNGLVNDNVLSITGAGDALWLATLGGASRIKIDAKDQKKLQFENFNQEDGIGFNYIYQVYADSKNRIWFATDGKGLTKLEDGRFTN